MKNYTFVKFPIVIAIILTISIPISGCNAFKKQESSEPNYKELKQMVIDIMQTEDGKKAIQEAMGEPKLQKQMVLDNKDVEKIIQQEFFSAENKNTLKSMYEDPKFAADLAKALKKENEKLLKDLMKDPEYRKMLIDVMKDKEYEEIVMEIMKSNDYRTQTMMIMKDALQSPMFKYDMVKLMEEANKQALKPEKDKEKGKESKGEEEDKGQEDASEE